jgi:hypothetical protein
VKEVYQVGGLVCVPWVAKVCAVFDPTPVLGKIMAGNGKISRPRDR